MNFTTLAKELASILGTLTEARDSGSGTRAETERVRRIFHLVLSHHLKLTHICKRNLRKIKEAKNATEHRLFVDSFLNELSIFFED